jgi:hypothetical protein
VGLTFAGFALPDHYHAPSLGKVLRPGGDQVEDIPTASKEELEAEQYMAELDALETEED